MIAYFLAALLQDIWTKFFVSVRSAIPSVDSLSPRLDCDGGGHADFTLAANVFGETLPTT